MQAKYIKEILNEEERSTAIKIIKTAERDGYLKGMESSAEYVWVAAKEIAKEWDTLHIEQKKIFRDTIYNKFLKKIHKK